MRDAGGNGGGRRDADPTMRVDGEDEDYDDDDLTDEDDSGATPAATSGPSAEDLRRIVEESLAGHESSRVVGLVARYAMLERDAAHRAEMHEVLTDTALFKKLKTTHPHDIVELNNYETMPSLWSTRYGCEEVCAYCYGTDNNLSFTRLIWCKDCQCSFHSECMRTISNEEDTSTCEPSCYYKCDELRKDSVLFAASSSLSSSMRPLLLEALIKDRTFMERVTPELLLEASVDDKNLMCLV